LVHRGARQEGAGVVNHLPWRPDFDVIDWSDPAHNVITGNYAAIPIGPSSVVARILFRTPRRPLGYIPHDKLMVALASYGRKRR
jgi:hypothetical protein